MESYRGWQITEEPDGTARLLSTGYSSKEFGRPYWKSRSMIATCAHGCRVADCLENHECTCGLYSVKSLEALVQAMILPVYGKINNEGVVVEFERGYRSEMATILELYVNDPESRLAEKLRVCYPGVLILPYPEAVVKAAERFEREYESHSSYLAKQAKHKEKLAALHRLMDKYPGGLKAESERLRKLLSGKSLDEVKKFAIEYGESLDWSGPAWAFKVENSRKAKPGDIVFEVGDDFRPYFFIGSTRHPSAQASVRILMDRIGNLKRVNRIQKWDEEPDLTEARAYAIATW